MSGKIKPNSRVMLLIYPKFQLFLVASHLGALIFVMAISLLEISRSFHQFVEIGEAIHLPPDHVFFKLIDLQATRLYSSVGLIFLAAFLVSTLITLVISHRLVGPMVRLRGYFLSITRLKRVPSKLKFRENDFFADLPPAINDALDTLVPKT